MIAYIIEVIRSVETSMLSQSEAERVPLFGPWRQLLIDYTPSLTRPPRNMQ